MNCAVIKGTIKPISEDVVNPKRTAIIGISSIVLMDENVLIAKERFSLGCHSNESNIFPVTTDIAPAMGNCKAAIFKSVTEDSETKHPCKFSIPFDMQ
ncbi:Conserved hypothetical protein [Candidatus Protochlamydia naegleriophila]|uniref:Uncharacterized protein n=1 Tax=Candidatus Protochlamydia naegleriophila TaxID=389348 RepID=A0A0U5CQY1_9BACT|nr:hypothetical protein [Candidatus Protochlamydia naegleriophila]CUI17292.1 Conserved hypothetical protein [Candidatus Protochlamydia naegleriophila]